MSSRRAGRRAGRGGRTLPGGRLLAALLVLGAMLSACSSAHGSPPSADRTPAAGFLDRYLSDGRVLRHDQGDDVVSEGQAYGMLLAEAAGRASDARAIWQWTAAHLRQPSGLLAFHAGKDGRIVDAQPAADADVLAAWALLRYRGPDASGLHADGAALAAAVLDRETVQAPDGTRMLAAGPWATGQPATINPSYWMPPVFRALRSATGDARWAALADASTPRLRSLTRQGAILPPDWARLDGSTLTPEPSPNGNEPQVRYGLDAQRIPIWFAVDCVAASRDLAGRWWPLLSPSGHAQAIALSPDGTVVDPATNPLPLLAAAAAARAAGQSAAANALAGQAGERARETPTYYGDAWVALDAALRGPLAPC